MASRVPSLPGGETYRQVAIIRLGDELFAIPVEDVLEILPAMAFTPLPDAPAVVRGVANLRGTAVPLLDLRVRLGLPVTPPDPQHHIIITTIGSRTVGVWVDRAESLMELDQHTMVPVTEVAAADHVEGVVLLPDGVLLVRDVASFLSADEALLLDRALDEAALR